MFNYRNLSLYPEFDLGYNMSYINDNNSYPQCLWKQDDYSSDNNPYSQCLWEKNDYSSNLWENPQQINNEIHSNPYSKFDFIRGEDMGNGWEKTPDFSYLNNSPLHVSLTANTMREQAPLKYLDWSLIKNREILKPPYPYSKDIYTNDCYQSPRFYPFAMRTRWNEGENQGITYATPEDTLTDQNTKYGISQTAYNRYRKHYNEYPDLVRDLSENQAMNLMCQEYYKPSRVEAINDANVAFGMFDSFFNGYNDSVKAWQQTLRNYSNPNLQIGGGIGSETINALNKSSLPSSFLQELITNRLSSVKNKYDNGIANRMNTYNIGVY
ncbi:MAG: hypothetical protein IJ019_03790 [Alphaproteobacteria bacterium]|nr:hypothetical protein [Alphaproteobacteria bacterium]